MSYPTTRRRSTALAAMFVALGTGLAVVGCSSDDSGTEPSSSTSSTTPSSSATTTPPTSAPAPAPGTGSQAPATTGGGVAPSAPGGGGGGGGEGGNSPEGPSRTVDGGNSAPVRTSEVPPTATIPGDPTGFPGGDDDTGGGNPNS